MSSILREQSAVFMKKRPELRPGYTVRVHERITEGDKSRVQIFEGLIIAIHKGATPTDSTFTVRKIASGVGAERVFSLHSPFVEKIDVKKVANVRRAKLFFLRGRQGKSARLSERFTTADEFSVATLESTQAVDQEGASQETAPIEEAKAEDTAVVEEDQGTKEAS